MEGSDRELIERMIRLFNRMLGPDDAAYRAEVERVWADEPEIVPMRAALEGNIYRGPDAVEDFRRASRETWAVLEVELHDVTGTGPRYLCSATLRSRGRESGAEITAPVWAVIDIAEGRVSRVATTLERDHAVAQFEEDR